ncbi:VaFE repeat-containing surface-anchored protein [bacterium]|nr:VaFE repeat-containing surface-anchored protein [bacterium]
MNITRLNKKTIFTRVTSAVMAAAMSLSCVSTGLIGSSPVAESLVAEAANGSGTYQPGMTYYDAGTMWLNGYYDPNTGNNVAYGDNYEEYWQTYNVTSCVTDSTVTLPGTTDINDDDVFTMQCYKDHINDPLCVDYGAPGARWGIDDIDGDGVKDDAMLYNYVAQGRAKALPNGDIGIDWEIRAWRAWDDTNNSFMNMDNLDTVAEITAEWDDKTIFEANAPVWASGNTNWDDWSDPSSSHGNNYLQWGYDATSPLYWTSIITYPHAMGDDAVTQPTEGIYVTLSLPSLYDSSVFELCTINGLNASGNYEVNAASGVYPANTYDVAKLGIDFAYISDLKPSALFKYIYTGCVCGAKTSDANCTCTWADIATATTFPAYDIPSMLYDLWHYSVKELKAADPNITGVRLYDIYSDVFFEHPTTNQFVTSSYNGTLGNSLHYNFTGNGNTIEMTDAMADVTMRTTIYDTYAVIDGHRVPVDNATVVDQELANTEANRTAIASDVKYDTTYDYQRSGGSISGSRRADAVATLTTNAVDSTSNSHIGIVSNTATVIDTLSYTGLSAGKIYNARGELYIVSGNTVTSTGIVSDNNQFVASGSAGTTTVQFNFDSTPYAGKNLVVYETITDKTTGDIVSTHYDPTDVNQTLYYVNIDTVATDTASGGKQAEAVANASITDVITYDNLQPGSYYFEGTLMKKVNGEGFVVLDSNGDPITARSSNFTIGAGDSGSGTASTVFNFDATGLSDETIVVYEKLIDATTGTIYIHHADINDEQQTVRYTSHPISIDTVAIDATSSSKQGVCSENGSIKDTITYTNLKGGSHYVAEGVIYLLNDDGTASLLLIDNKPVKSIVEFSNNLNNPNDYFDGTLDVTFGPFDTRGLAGKTIVVYETIYQGQINNGNLPTTIVATHQDATDTDQMVYFPAIDTVAVDEASNSHTAVESGNLIIKDTVTYDNVVPGNTYSLIGTLMTVSNGAAVAVQDASGKAIISRAQFTPTSKNGSVDVTFTFDATAYADENVTVYEKLATIDSTPVVFVSHEDIADLDQTVYIEKGDSTITVATDAIDVATGTQQGVCSTTAKISDNVVFTDLTIGESYTVEGQLFEVSANNVVTPVMNNGKQVTKIVTFEADAVNDSVNVEFEFDSTAYAGKTIVVYEYLYEGTSSGGILLGNPVASHADATDARQKVYYPAIDTVAVGTGTTSHNVVAGKTTSITDTVTYNNLVVNQAYRLVGSLMTKSDAGLPVAVTDANGSAITFHKDFTATTSNGSVDVIVTFDSTKYAGKSVVVYEKLVPVNKTDVILVSHDDINDADQTVNVTEDATVVSIQTDAVNGRTNTQTATTSSKDKIVDKVAYTGLEAGKNYSLVGKLYVVGGNNSVTAVKNGTTEITKTVTFVPTAANGSVDVTFEFDSTAYAGKSIVVYEHLYEGITNGNVVLGTPIAQHADSTDTRQIVKYRNPVVPAGPEITTVAKDGITGDNIGSPIPGARIVDTVYYSKLDPDKTYIVEGILYDKSRNMPVEAKFDFNIGSINGNDSAYTIDVNGNVVATSKKFKPNSKGEGSVSVTFVFDATSCRGRDIVVFETLYEVDEDDDWTEVASHEDIDDYDQTIQYPNVYTEVRDSDTNSHEAVVSPNTRITDEIYCRNLIVGERYTLAGYLVNKSNGKVLVDKNGEQLSASFTFVATDEKCTKYLTYEFDSSDMSGKAVVAMANIYHNNKLVYSHDDINDELETIYFPEIRTVATSENGGKNLDPIKAETIVDTVTYTNLMPNTKYRLTGSLVDKASGVALKGANGLAITVNVDFKSSATGSGTVDVVFDNIDVSRYANKDIVVFQSLYNMSSAKPVLLIEDNDINNQNETVHVNEPTVKTVLADTETKSKEIIADSEVLLSDTIIYTGLVPGNEYVVVSTLMDKDTKKELKDDAGNPVVITSDPLLVIDSHVELTADFTFVGIDLAGKVVVAYNDLYRVVDGKNYLVISEHDLANKDQTVEFAMNAEIDTVATDKASGSHTLTYSEKAQITDRVFYVGLKDGQTYTLKGVVYDKATGEPAKNIKAVSLDFVADKNKGYVDVVFNVNATKHVGMDLVVFETLFYKDKEVCAHKDINDAGQTVSVSHISTVLTGSNRTSKTVGLSKNLVLVDTIRFSGLTPGRTYQVTGHILDREVTNDEVLIIDGSEGSNVTNGQKIISTSTITFVPTESEGSVSMEFVVNTSSLSGHHLVAFETIADAQSNAVVAEHKDINDANQTVLVKTSTWVNTGADNFTGVFAGAAVILLVGFVVLLVVLKKKNSDK